MVSSPTRRISGSGGAARFTAGSPPRTASALDGGTDGLHFYRCIAALWVPRLVRGGVCAVETGEDQGRAVAALFEQFGLREVRVEKDFNGLDRVVSGIR